MGQTTQEGMVHKGQATHGQIVHGNQTTFDWKIFVLELDNSNQKIWIGVRQLLAYGCYSLELDNSQWIDELSWNQFQLEEWMNNQVGIRQFQLEECD